MEEYTAANGDGGPKKAADITIATGSAAITSGHRQVIDFQVGHGRPPKPACDGYFLTLIRFGLKETKEEIPQRNRLMIVQNHEPAGVL